MAAPKTDLDREIENIISADTDRMFDRIDTAARRAGVTDPVTVARIVDRFGGGDLAEFFQDWCED